MSLAMFVMQTCIWRARALLCCVLETEQLVILTRRPQMHHDQRHPSTHVYIDTDVPILIYLDYDSQATDSI